MEKKPIQPETKTINRKTVKVNETLMKCQKKIQLRYLS